MHDALLALHANGNPTRHVAESRVIKALAAHYLTISLFPQLIEFGIEQNKNLASALCPPVVGFIFRITPDFPV